MARPSKQQEIKIWLKGALSSGRRKADEVLIAGQNTGYPPRTLRRTKASLGIISEQSGEIWYWRDPAVTDLKVQTEDKLDILLHEVKETQRLAQAPVPAATESTQISLGKGKPYDRNAPENIAIAEAFKKTEERWNQIDHIVASADPFKLLESADLDETKLMLVTVRNHRAELDERNRRLKYGKNEKGQLHFVGYEDANEDITYEAGKWDEWIDRAKERIKQLEKQERDRESDLDGVLAT